VKPAAFVSALLAGEGDSMMLLRDPIAPTVPPMRATAKLKSPSSGEKLTIEEIWRRYPNEWVVLTDTDWDGARETEGFVYAHSPKKDEARAAARGLRSCALYWTGKIQSPRWWFLTHGRRSV
jgi:hypothetical protein